MADLDCTYLTVFDWSRGEQEVRFVHRTGEVSIDEGSRRALPPTASPEVLLGVTRSPAPMPQAPPDSHEAKRLGLRTYVSVPVVLPTHELFGMVCGAGRRPRQVGEPVVGVMESFARIVADHVSRERLVAAEERAERAEQDLRARAVFVAAAEHQLKTPLTSLLGAAQILRDGWPALGPEERDRLLDMVIRAASDLSDRVKGLLVEARADVDSRDLVPVALDLADFVAPIARTFDAVSDHHVRAEVEEGLTALADPGALHQVLGHLLDNAVKYTRAQSTITVAGRSTPGGVEIDVSDDGPGLPVGVDVFAPFRRGNHSGGADGIGLGLHIVRNLVLAMGGTVDATSNAGGGTTFTVRLPSVRRRLAG